MTDKYKNNYLRLIKQYISGNNQCFPKHTVFEILSAIDLDMILWDDLPPDFDTKFNVPHKMDYGVDLITLEYDKCCQVKLYNENSRITWTDFSTFYTYSKGILNIDNMVLYTTPVAKIDKMCIQSIQNDSNIEVIRQDFDDLIDKYSTDINRIDCSTSSSTSSSSLEERHYLLECYKIFNESTESQLYFQLPCGTGKSYIMLYILSKYIQEHPESRHIIFCPWIDLAKQTYELFVTNNIKTDFIGDGKHSITKDSNVIVCINMSVSHIPADIEITYKIIDEAHHLESEDSQIRKQINKLQCIKELNLSATFHNQECLDFNYPMNEAIEDGYISDYQMVIGYFESGDKTDELVSLIKNHTEWSPMFVYFNTTEKCKVFNDKLNKENINSTYLTGNTSSIEREQSKTDIENDKLQVVCLCGVYNEGVSIDCLQTVVFGDLRHSQINKIQIAMRANRKHSCKPLYRVVLPVVESDFSEKDIHELIRTFAEIDPRLVEDIRNKNQLRVKLIINGGSNKANLENAELLYEQVYDRMGVMIEGMSAEEIWFMKFEMLKEFIDKNGNTPNQIGKEKKEQSLGNWLSTQKTNYIKQIMKSEKIYNTWTEFINDPIYIDYFKTDEEKWFMKFKKLKMFIDEHKITPNKRSKLLNESILGNWFSSQKRNYKKKSEIMKLNAIVYDTWGKFIINPQYIDYFKTNEEKWYDHFDKFKQFINVNNKTPSRSCKDDLHEKQLGYWYGSQLKNYKEKLQIMKTSLNVYNTWTEFIHNPVYNEYLRTTEEIWYDNFNQLKIFIYNNCKLPNSDINRTRQNNKSEQILLNEEQLNEKHLGHWLCAQKQNYKNKNHIMTNKEIYDSWKNFINDTSYIDYFKTNEELWYINLNKLKDFINENKNTPIQTGAKNKYEDILGGWFASQKNSYSKKNHIMKNKEIYNTWTEFINDPIYIDYFKTNEQKWYDNLSELKVFIKDNNKLPSNSSKNIDEVTLYNWISSQKQNYIKKLQIMSNEDIYKCWSEFINNRLYIDYFKTNEEKWYDNLNELKQFINLNSKLPSLKNNQGDIIEKELIRWLYTQKCNYKNKNHIMKNKEIFNKWTEFINDPLYYTNYFKPNDQKWYDNLSELKVFIKDNNKLPINLSKNIDEVTLYNWISSQKQNYKKKREIMNNEEIYNTWTEFINNPLYINYFKTNRERWYENFELLKSYILINNKKPSDSSKNKEQQQLGGWFSSQKKNYKKQMGIASDDEIYNTWTTFINDPKYINYFKTDHENWDDNYDELIKFIANNNSLPSKLHKDEKKLCTWVHIQTQNYKNKKCIMKNHTYIYNKWTEFINNPKYENYFKNDIENWYLKFNKLKDYINENNKTPIQCGGKGKYTYEIQLGAWLGQQKNNYSQKNHSMKNQEIYNSWTEFINDPIYIDSFKTNKDLWFESLDKLKDFININNKTPTQCGDKDKHTSEIQLGKWLGQQKNNYSQKNHSMKNEEIYNSWTEFINDPKYINYFKTDEDIWFESLDKLKHFITINNKKPRSDIGRTKINGKRIQLELNDEELNEKQVGSWLLYQVTNHKKKNKIMKDEKIYNTWTRFTTDYIQYL